MIPCPSIRLDHRAVRLTLLLMLVGAHAAQAQSADSGRNGAVVLPGLPVVRGQEVDRVVAIVNGDIILDSDVDQELRFDRLSSNDPGYSLVTESQAASGRDDAIERLINRDLILQQLRLEPETPISDSDVDQQIGALRKSIPACARYKCETTDGWRNYLASIGFTEESFRQRWKERMKVLAFTEQRFRMGIRITQDQIKTYYTKVLLPQYHAAGVSAPPMETIASKIQNLLLEQQVTLLLDDWLHSLRAQGSVVVLHPGEDAP